MADLRPPRLATGEAETLLTLLRFQRESLVRKVDAVESSAAARSPVASGTTLLWLVRHMAWAERLWVLHSFAGGPAPDGGADAALPAGSIAAAVAVYRSTWAEVDAVIEAAPSLDEPCQVRRGDDIPNLRWVVAHLLQETARHAGHADILRELIDGQVGR